METSAVERQVAQEFESGLTSADQEWLDSYGVDPSWQTDQDLQDELARWIALGSQRLNTGSDEAAKAQVVSARSRFMEFVGISGSLPADSKRLLTLVPLDTFIGAQREMFAQGINSPKVIKAAPEIASYSAAHIKSKINNMHELGIDAPKVINNYARALSLAETSVREKIDKLNGHGLDALKIVNKFGGSLGMADKTIDERIATLKKLKIDHVKVLNGCPNTLRSAPDTVNNKFFTIEEHVKKLGWQHTAQELVEAFPQILGYCPKKLNILMAIATRRLDEGSRNMTPAQVKQALIAPLESYIIDLDTCDSSERVSLQQLCRNARARAYKLNAEERRQQALSIARNGLLGHVGEMYLRYRSQPDAVAVV